MTDNHFLVHEHASEISHRGKHSHELAGIAESAEGRGKGK